MKILLTGMTNIQCGGRRAARSDYVTFYYILKRVLRDLGHEVEHRLVTPGEDLSSYDFAFVGMGSFGSRVTMAGKFGALWTAANLNHVVTWDDWQVQGVCKTLSNDDGMWGERLLDTKTRPLWEAARQHRDRLDEVRHGWASGFDRTLAPLFNWGDPGVFANLHPMGTLYHWDPSPFVDDKASVHLADETITSVPRRRRWVCAALGDKSGWIDKQELTWSIERHYRHAGVFQKESENDVVRDYCRCWGVLAPGYGKIEGAGWWRARFNFAAQAGAIMLADHDEVAPLGQPFAIVGAQVESLIDRELGELAHAQMAELRKHEHPPAVAAQRFAVILEDLVGA